MRRCEIKLFRRATYSQNKDIGRVAMSKRFWSCFFAITSLVLVSTVIFPTVAEAHGERAQMASLRMRTMNWFDTEIYPRKLAINEVLTVRGKFSPSVWWPDNVASIENSAYLNIGVPGPVFVRVDSKVNGVPMVRSTRFEFGKTYEYEIKLKARRPGRYHVHPVVSVESAGPIIGPAFWVEVTGNAEDFTNSFTTLTGQEINTETFAMDTIFWWNALWFVIGAAWLGWWFRKRPTIMPRYIQTEELGDDANKLITIPDMIVSFLFFGGVLVVIAGGFLYTQYKYPITTPLQTGKVVTPPMPEQPKVVEVSVEKATYRIPGRSFEIKLKVTNYGDKPIQVGEYLAANIRFINPKVLPNVKPQDEHDLVATNGLIVNDPAVQPGETRSITLYAEDALWETQRLTGLIYEPDSRFAGMIFFFDSEGNRYHIEVGGAMLPQFV